MIPWKDLKAILEQDAEFRHASRHWTADLRLSLGDQHRMVRFRDGGIAAVEPCDADSSCDVFLGGPETEWRELLRNPPRPFYQDPFFASVHHGVEMNPEQLDYAAWYPAIRRLVEVLRETAAQGPGGNTSQNAEPGAQGTDRRALAAT